MTAVLQTMSIDILLFLTNPHVTLPVLLEEFCHFNLISNLKINFSKSFALNISLPSSIVTQCTENFPFQWKEDTITYLGIQLTAKLKDLYMKNYSPILNKLSIDLKNWHKPFFSWFGRAGILKMNALPPILYILQTVPIQLHTAFFRSYRSLCCKVFWGEQRPRINYAQLSLPKHLGGIGLPELLNYYKAVHLSRIIEWNIHAPNKDWVSLEASFTSIPLKSLPWIQASHLHPDIGTHPLITPMLQCFRKICKHSSLLSSPGPMTPIKLNPNFPPGLHRSFLQQYWSQEQVLINHFYDQGKLHSASQLAKIMDKPPIPAWTYLLISHYLRSVGKNLTVYNS